MPLSRQNSQIATASSSSGQSERSVDEPVLVYHESARSIVFRDHLRRAVERSTKDNEEPSSPSCKPNNNKKHDWKEEVSALTSEVLEIIAPHSPVIQPSETLIAGFQPNIVPLPKLELGPSDEYQALYESHAPDKATEGFSAAEIEVCQMLKEQRCVVKTVKNVDWTDFLDRFHVPHKSRGRSPDEHDDIPASADFHFNSFVTSTTMLPEYGKKMRCFGSPSQYTVGVVFALPSEYADADAEDEAATRTKTWSWPAGYSVRFS
jgi:hypothetical protein